jgi:hypothetical protein
MRDEFSRFLLILAGMNLSKKELHLLVMRLKSSSYNEIASEILRIRNSCLERDNRPFDLVDEPVSNKAYRSKSVGDRVERLMRDEANLSGQAAFSVLSNLFVEHGLLSASKIPPLSKKALRIWIDKIISLGVPEKELLRIATIARNSYSHNRPTDWQLGGRDK